MRADQLPVPLGEEEALGVEPRLPFAQLDLQQAPATLVGVGGEGQVVQRRPGLLVAPDLEGTHQDPLGQLDRRQRVAGQRPAQLEQHPAAREAEPFGQSRGRRGVAVGPEPQPAGGALGEQLLNQGAAQPPTARMRGDGHLGAGAFDLVGDVQVGVADDLAGFAQ